jgi:hypothetical protein
MSDLVNVTLERCNRPSDEEVAALEAPHRPFADGNGWYAHYFYLPGGTPAFKRLTHGDHDDLWYRVLASDVPDPAV